MSTRPSIHSTPNIDPSQVLSYLTSLSESELRATLESDPTLLSEINTLFPDLVQSTGLSASPASHPQYSRGRAGTVRPGAGKMARKPRGWLDEKMSGGLTATPRGLRYASSVSSRGSREEQSSNSGPHAPNNTPHGSGGAPLGIDLTQLHNMGQEGFDLGDLSPMSIPLPVARRLLPPDGQGFRNLLMPLKRTKHPGDEKTLKQSLLVLSSMTVWQEYSEWAVKDGFLTPLVEVLHHPDPFVGQHACQILLNIANKVHPDVLLPPLRLHEGMVSLLSNVTDTSALQPACKLMKLMVLRLAITLPHREIEVEPIIGEDGEEIPQEPLKLAGALQVMPELATSMAVLMEDNDQVIRHTSTMIYNDMELHQRITEVRDLQEIQVTEFDSLLELLKSKKNSIVSWACTAMGMILEISPKEEFLQPRFLKPMISLLKHKDPMVQQECRATLNAVYEANAPGVVDAFKHCGGPKPPNPNTFGSKISRALKQIDWSTMA